MMMFIVYFIICRSLKPISFSQKIRQLAPQITTLFRKGRGIDNIQLKSEGGPNLISMNTKY